jgi:hypothetical protein
MATSVASNTLNVTRVGGLAAVVASIGAVALALYGVDKATDHVPIVVAAYVSVGAIVAAALISMAITISADVRARGSTSVAAQTLPAPLAQRATISNITGPEALALPVDVARIDASSTTVVDRDHCCSLRR